MTILSVALADMAQGLWRWPLWTAMAWHDIRLKYRRSTLGPLWVTLSTAIWCGTLGILFSRLFGQPYSFYIPYLAAGKVIWDLISGIIIESSNAMMSAAGHIKQADTPYTIFICRLVWRHFLIFVHNMVVFVVVAVMFGVVPSWQLLLWPVALLVFFVNGVWTAMLLGLIGARFRDIPPIINSIMQVMIFITPIIWHQDIMERKAGLLGNLISINPFLHFVEVLRAPLLGEVASATNWNFVLVTTGVGLVISVLLFGRLRHHIPYWL